LTVKRNNRGKDSRKEVGGEASYFFGVNIEIPPCIKSQPNIGLCQDIGGKPEGKTRCSKYKARSAKQAVTPTICEVVAKHEKAKRNHVGSREKSARKKGEDGTKTEEP